ncbi:MAG: hypothetical protein B7Y45_12470 [Sphingomonas sp. 28-66-16]|nr:MAG: hypothetical protein B7Y45_12470 [Sphingomonas sp. 28-66-16]
MTRPALALALPLALLALPLAGCGEGHDGEGTTITLNAGDKDGNFTAGVDGNTGQVAIDAPGFTGKLTLPRFMLSGTDVDLNGAKLYPGSKVTSMNINAGGDDKSSVRIVFDSPAAPEKVRDWFADKLAKADFSLKSQGMALVGTDNEHKPFRLEITPAGADRSKGTITAGS